MGVRAPGGLLARWAGRRPHVLLVPVPGRPDLRLCVETAISAMGGVLSASPADADLLVVAGAAAPELCDAVNVVWHELPGPRARLQIDATAGLAQAMDRAVESLSAASQYDDAAGRRDESSVGRDESDDPDMGMPGGLPMADRAADRDGLPLDVLHVPLGPVLADWPAGLVIDTVLQGDLVQQAEGRVLRAPDAPSSQFWTVYPTRNRSRALDSLGRFLAVAGWDAAAAEARALRDALLDVAAGETAGVEQRLDRLDRRLRRSRTLRLLGDGLGRAGDGDVTARWRAWLDAAGSGSGTPAVVSAGSQLEQACRQMVGLDLGQARLVLASFDPDPDTVDLPDPRDRIESTL